jgi:hypothetical protein
VAIKADLAKVGSTSSVLQGEEGPAHFFYNIFFLHFLYGLRLLTLKLLISPISYFFRDVWIGTQRAAVASKRVTNLATHLPP